MANRERDRPTAADQRHQVLQPAGEAEAVQPIVGGAATVSSIAARARCARTGRCTRNPVAGVVEVAMTARYDPATAGRSGPGNVVDNLAELPAQGA